MNGSSCSFVVGVGSSHSHRKERERLLVPSISVCRRLPPPPPPPAHSSSSSSSSSENDLLFKSTDDWTNIMKSLFQSKTEYYCTPTYADKYDTYGNNNDVHVDDDCSS